MFIQEHALASQQRFLSKSELLSNILVFKISFSVNVKLQKKEKKSLSILKIRSILTILPITVQLCAFYFSISVELAQAASACAATD